MHESVTAFAIATLLLGLGAALVHRWHFPPLAAYLLVGLVLGEYLDTESLEPLPSLGLLLLVNVECDALLLDEESRTDTYPYIEVGEETAHVGHEATVSKINDEQIFYLQTRGLKEDEAAALIVRGFIEPIAKELPLEYAVELNRLIELEMEGSVG